MLSSKHSDGSTRPTQGTSDALCATAIIVQTSPTAAVGMPPSSRRNRDEILRPLQSAAPLDSPHAGFFESMSPEDVASYKRRRAALEEYIASSSTGRCPDAIARKYGLSRATLWRLAHAAASPNTISNKPLGFWACVKGRTPNHVQRHERRSEFKQELARAGLGMKGALSAFFKQHPDIEADLRYYFLHRALRGDAPVTLISPASFYGVFLRLCKLKGLQHASESSWPFNCATQGRGALTEHFSALARAYPARAAKNIHGIEAGADYKADAALVVSNESRAPQSVAHRPDVYERVELDEHIVHAEFTITVPNRDGIPLQVAVTRFWVLTLVEAATGAVLAATVCFDLKYRAGDIKRLIVKALFPPPPLQLTLDDPDWRYNQGAAFPAELPEMRGKVWRTLAMDADRAHLSVGDGEALKRLTGSVPSYEKIGNPRARHNVERFFKEVSALTKSLPSTTGSNTVDPARQNSAHAAVKYDIRVEFLAEIADLWARNINAKVRQSTGTSRLLALKSLLAEGRVFPGHAQEFPGYQTELVKLAWTPFFREVKNSRGKSGVPVVHAIYCSYTSSALIENKQLATTSDRRVTLYINDDDYTQAVVVPVAFPSLSIRVYAQGKVSPAPLFEHILRQRIQRALAAEHRADSPVPMHALLTHLGERAASSRDVEDTRPLLLLSQANTESNLGAAPTVAAELGLLIQEDFQDRGRESKASAGLGENEILCPDEVEVRLSDDTELDRADVIDVYCNLTGAGGEPTKSPATAKRPAKKVTTKRASDGAKDEPAAAPESLWIPREYESVAWPTAENSLFRSEPAQSAPPHSSAAAQSSPASLASPADHEVPGQTQQGAQATGQGSSGGVGRTGSGHDSADSIQAGPHPLANPVQGRQGEPLPSVPNVKSFGLRL